MIKFDPLWRGPFVSAPMRICIGEFVGYSKHNGPLFAADVQVENINCGRLLRLRSPMIELNIEPG